LQGPPGGWQHDPPMQVPLQHDCAPKRQVSVFPKQSQVLPSGLQKLEQHCTSAEQPMPTSRHTH
jgi:hypothetical protein